MQLTEKQLKGLEIAVARYKTNEKCTIISGYAGSGKSTLVKFIIAALSAYGIDPQEDVCYCAFTGKASEVLRQKGNPNCKTAHKLLYKTRPNGYGGFTRIPVDNIKEKIVVVDECSMLPMDMTKLLLSYNVYVIFCGDPGQLPPIDKTQDNMLLLQPHIFLDEIMRQAEDSGIIQLSLKIRNGEPFDGFRTDDVMVLDERDFDPTMMLWADQVLCATNRTRNYLNQLNRNLLGYTNPIEEGEKLIGLRNYWETFSDDLNPLTNGCIGTLKNMKYSDVHLDYKARNRIRPQVLEDNKIPVINGDLVTDFGDTFFNLSCDRTCITTGESLLTNRSKARLSKVVDLPVEMTYAYAITTHKAQGSEWDKVLVIEEGFPFDREEHKHWLYTAATRAAKKLVILRRWTGRYAV